MRGLVAAGVCLALAAPNAVAQTSVALQASQHFQRGVDLYGEGDFRGALVEFNQAYALLPRSTVLYDIGQTHYQLQEYAQALRALERFLAETGPTAAHRSEVEKAVEVLRGRVGHIVLTANRAGCEVTVDEELAGTTPLRQPVLVSVGRRTVAVVCPDKQHAERDVEVSAQETVAVEMKVPVPAPPAPVSAVVAMPAVPPRGSRRGAAWIVTGVLAAATVGLYAATLIESRQLATLRDTYPVERQELRDKATLISRLALGGDIAAGATVFAAGVATYLSLSASPAEERGVHLALTWSGLALRGGF